MSVCSPYVELHSRSAFSFLRGAAQPEALARRAAELGLPAMALSDRDGLYGAPRFFAAARECGLRPIIGSELTMECGGVLPVLVESHAGYQNLCRLITRARLRGSKHASAVRWDELAEFAPGLVALTGDEEGPLHRALGDDAAARAVLEKLAAAFGGRGVFVEIQRHRVRGENRFNAQLTALAAAHRLPLLATNGVLYDTPANREVLDVFTCIREHTHLDAAGRLLARNNRRALLDGRAMSELFHDLPDAITNTARLAERLEFSLENLGYEFPRYPLPDGASAEDFLRRETLAGARRRYGRLSRRVARQLRHELDLIGRLGFAGYFLIVWDIVNFCRAENIMVQGRGSAANSAVCYSLGITAVDAVKSELLFERFLSEGRKSWPDIDLDLPSGDRRERVIQEVYRRYGKNGAAMTANVITYRGRSAMREIGKALNFPADIMERFSSLFANGDFPHTLDLQAQMEMAGLPRENTRAAHFASLYQRIHGLPRHLGQHSGGMIIAQGRLDSVMPLENASMPGRVVAQWDKDDCEELGIIKVDLLGLGMMSVLQDTIELCRERGREIDLATIPQDDPATYEMMQRADTIGVFQIESRAQMATLPRMKPECFYDVVVEVAIIRPGPIQGNMLHPYLARRSGREPVTYMHPDLEPVLKRTLGVPLFQEQLLKMAMVMADFSGSEAEELRRALSFHRSAERMEKVCVKLRAAMVRRHVAADIIEQIVKSVQSFAVYGFPESHAISFALLTYASAWLKVHRPAEFCANLLNNQPMGFYSSATLVKDAQRHGLRVRPVCLARSEWRCTLEADDTIRLGLCVVKGLRCESGERLLAERGRGEFASVEELKRRVTLSAEEWRTLAAIGALNALAAHRRDALWRVEAPQPADDLFTRNAPTAEAAPLRVMEPHERLSADFAGQELTIGAHSMQLLRASLPDVWRAADLVQARTGELVRIAGAVICRQRPGTAKGYVFVSLEDETGTANAVLTPELFEQYRLVVTQEPFLQIEGVVQNAENVIHIKARRVTALRHEAATAVKSYDFH